MPSEEEIEAINDAFFGDVIAPPDINKIRADTFLSWYRSQKGGEFTREELDKLHECAYNIAVIHPPSAPTPTTYDEAMLNKKQQDDRLEAAVRIMDLYKQALQQPIEKE